METIKPLSPNRDLDVEITSLTARSMIILNFKFNKFYLYRAAN